MKLPDNKQLEKIYGECNRSKERFQNLAHCFSQKYHQNTMEFFSAPGRTEIIGNHTDHNGGQVIAASIDMDTIGAAFPNGSNSIRITSEGYKQEILIDLSKLDSIVKDQSTQSLVGGMMAGIKNFGFHVSGFDAFISTNVLAAAGVSSSASFEMLICSIVNYFFNNNSMSYVDYAKIGKYAENIYWNKFSGMMDQMACAVGGTVLFDFSNNDSPDYQKMNFSFQDIGYQLVIVNTGKGHADLSHEYSEIPLEMENLATALGVRTLCETDMENLLSHYSAIKNDRAILRAMHFFKETERVKKATLAIKGESSEDLLRLIDESGTSSFEWLQNCYSIQNYKEQKISLSLALTKLFLQKTGKGVCRVHGGGFAGVIMCLVPLSEKENYVNYISEFFGKENVYPMNIRNLGAIHLR